MKTVKEVSKLAGVSVRTLHYYDTIGLLKPTEVTGAGYRLYDDTALERLQVILLFRELEFPLGEIKTIMDSSGFDRRKALEQQIKLLELKREHLNNLINFARGIKATGVRNLSFKAFDTSKIDEYARKTKEAYGNTREYKEFQEKDKDRSSAERDELNQGLMDIMAEFGAIKDTDPAGDAAQRLVNKLQGYINEHFYKCSDQILCCLGRMYSGGGEINDNIDLAGGEGTGSFIDRAIREHCK